MILGTIMPTSPVVGQMYADSTTNSFQLYNGKTWVVVFPTDTPMSYLHYKVLEGPVSVDGLPWYSIECSAELMDWIRDTYILKVDYFEIRSLKGIWVDVPDRLLTMIKLKW